MQNEKREVHMGPTVSAAGVIAGEPHEGDICTVVVTLTKNRRQPIRGSLSTSQLMSIVIAGIYMAAERPRSCEC